MGDGLRYDDLHHKGIRGKPLHLQADVQHRPVYIQGLSEGLPDFPALCQRRVWHERQSHNRQVRQTEGNHLR